MLPRTKVLSAFQTTITRKTSLISALQATFRDPSSPFYQAPGTQGPESAESSKAIPDSLPNSPPPNSDLFNGLSSNDLQVSRHLLENNGFDPHSFSEQTIAWGDQDPFQHVNNAEYFRYFESARIKWMIALGQAIGGPNKARAMLNGQGISLILKSFQINFRRPVTFPDTLLIGYKILLPLEDDRDLSTFHVTASAYSLAQKSFVADTKEAIVWYDYDNLKKCNPEDKAIEFLRRSAGLNTRP